MAEFVGNSFKGKQQAPKQQPVVTARPIVKKRKLGFLDMFYNTSEKTFSQFVWQDLVIPNFNRACGTILHGIITKIFGVGGGYGPIPGYRYNGWSNQGSYQYNPNYIDYAAQGHAYTPQQKQAGPQQRPTASPRLEDYHLASRMDAENVLEGLSTIIEQFDVVNVSAFFELIGMPAPHTYNNYGWTNLADAKVIPVSDGWAIRFPTPIQL